MIKIIKQLIPESKYKLKSSNKMVPTRIVVHNTANDATARNEIKYMTNNTSSTSFHYAVDDKEIVQGIPENRNGWHAGDGQGKGNREGIAIEICYSKSGGERYLKAEDNAIDLIVDILNRYNWDIDKVTKHQDYSGKYCPHRTLDLGWERFIDKIRIKLSETKEKPFQIGEIIYNTEELYLYETAGYGGKKVLLEKNTKSIVKKYHYNNKYYMALGKENKYYEAAWTDEYTKFTKETPKEKDNSEVNNIINIEDYDIPKDEIVVSEVDKTVFIENENFIKQNWFIKIINIIIKFLKKIFIGKD